LTSSRTISREQETVGWVSDLWFFCGVGLFLGILIGVPLWVWCCGVVRRRRLLQILAPLGFAPVHDASAHAKLYRKLGGDLFGRTAVAANVRNHLLRATRGRPTVHVLDIDWDDDATSAMRGVVILESYRSRLPWLRILARGGVRGEPAVVGWETGPAVDLADRPEIAARYEILARDPARVGVLLEGGGRDLLRSVDDVIASAEDEHLVLWPNRLRVAGRRRAPPTLEERIDLAHRLLGVLSPPRETRG
jgi:hypothetical protein